jgi:pentatricopeptide repeat protein
MMFQDYNENGNRAAKPDEAAFNALVNGLALQQEVLQERRKKRATLKRLKNEVIDPEREKRERLEEQACFHTPERAEQILWRMEEFCDQGYLDFQPSVWVYSSVLKAWAKSGRHDGPERAKRILERMKEKYQSGENPALQPNSIAYNIVIDSYARAGKPVQALEVLQEMIDLHEKGVLDCGPNVLSYTGVINAHGRIRNKYWIQPEKAEEVFRRMVSMDDSRLKPEKICWTSLIDVYAKAAIFGDDKKKPTAAQCLDRAEELLVEMIESGVKPNILTFNTLLKAVAFSKFKTDRPARTKRILDMMKDNGVRADDYTRSVVADVMEGASTSFTNE